MYLFGKGLRGVFLLFFHYGFIWKDDDIFLLPITPTYILPAPRPHRSTTETVSSLSLWKLVTQDRGKHCLLHLSQNEKCLGFKNGAHQGDKDGLSTSEKDGSRGLKGSGWHRSGSTEFPKTQEDLGG